jgi:hypothetical protein
MTENLRVTPKDMESVFLGIGGNQKCCSVGNVVYTHESTWHILVNITIRWRYIYRSHWSEASDHMSSES